MFYDVLSGILGFPDYVGVLGYVFVMAVLVILFMFIFVFLLEFILGIFRRI